MANYFSKCSIADVWQGSDYASSSEYPRVLNKSLILNVLEFWIYRGFEYASSFEYAGVVNIPKFWICQGYTGFRICLNNSRICLNMPDYAWICLNMLEYALNMSKSAWMTFVLYFPISSFILQSLFYLNTWLLAWTPGGD